MPGQTTNFGIEYPCPGDTITTAAFQTWTEGIEAAINQVNTASTEATNRPRAMLRTNDTGYAVAFGAPTQILFDITVYNNGLDVGVLGPPFGGFVPEPTGDAGLYLLMAQFTPVNTATTVTSFEAEIISNNEVVAARTLASSAATTIARPISLMGVGIIDFIGGALVRFNWTGTGGPLNIYCQFSCQYIAPAVP
jgi:hypothetical protein